MSKAYNCVNITILIRALGRLGILESFIKFLISIFISRFNQIFTVHGNTDTYLVLSEIDQGEIISPILWCIYYDLISKIHSMAILNISIGGQISMFVIYVN